MIFVTVGHQMPFDRLIKAVDDWAARTERDDVFAQIGDSRYRPQHVECADRLSPREFRKRMTDASAVVGHAGTGTIIAAMMCAKPLLVLPRLSRLGETRNDHQIPTARYFAKQGYILAANDEDDLIAQMNDVERFTPRVDGKLNGHASPELLERLRRFALES